MKLKHLAAFLVLLAVGCSAQPSSVSTEPATNGDSTEAAATSTVEPATETELASTTVSFTVTGMS